MANSEVCTLYDRKNRTNSYDFLLITRVHDLLLSVSIKPIFDDFTLVIDMYHHHRRRRRHRQQCTFILKKIYLHFLFTVVIVKQSKCGLKKKKNEQLWAWAG